MSISGIRNVAIVGDRELTRTEHVLVQAITASLIKSGVNVRSCGSLGTGESVMVGYRSAGYPSELSAPYGSFRQYLPFDSFNGLVVNNHDIVGLDTYGPEDSNRAFKLAACHHGVLSGAVQARGLAKASANSAFASLFRLIARGALMVTGGGKEGPVDLVICVAEALRMFRCPRTKSEYCVDVDGNSGISVRIAASLGIPVLNLRLAADLSYLQANVMVRS
jgi:hypothetical protein